MTNKLKPYPCAFCGSPEVKILTTEVDTYYCKCMYCGASQDSYVYSNIAVEIWNTRNQFTKRYQQKVKTVKKERLNNKSQSLINDGGVRCGN